MDDEKFSHHCAKIIEFCGRNPQSNQLIPDTLLNIKQKGRGDWVKRKIYLEIVSAYITQKKPERVKEFLKLALEDLSFKSSSNLKEQLLFGIHALKIHQQLKEMAFNTNTYWNELILDFLEKVVSHNTSPSDQIELLSLYKGEELAKKDHIDPFSTLLNKIKDPQKKAQCYCDILSAYIKIGNKDSIEEYFSRLIVLFIQSDFSFENIKETIVKVKKSLENRKIDAVLNLLKTTYFTSNRFSVEKFLNLYLILDIKQANQIFDEYEMRLKKMKIKDSCISALLFGSVALLSHRYL